MKLYYGRVQQISEEIIRNLRDADAIDVGPEYVQEAELDVQGVLREYLRVDRELTQRAREMSDRGDGSYGKIKRQLARRANFKTGEDALDYVVDQLIEVLLHSHHIEEIYVDDRELRLSMTKVIKRLTEETEKGLDAVVRSRIKNLKEGDSSWNDEYDRALRQLKRQQKLDQS